MTDYSDGKWHGWNGGECPVHQKTGVEVVYFANASFGGKVTNAVLEARQVTWESEVAPIVAFRVVKAYRETRVIWVNEYPNGASTTYINKEKAIAFSGPSAVRTAVRYVEQPE